MRHGLFCWLIFVVVVGLVGSVRAGNLSIGCNYPDAEVVIKHESEATEGYDPGKDLAAISAPTGEINFYSQTNSSIYRLKWDARPTESMSIIRTAIYGNQLVGGSKAAYITFYINDMTNFVDKFIQAKLYQLAHVYDTYTVYMLVGTYDVKSLDRAIYPSAPPIPITVVDGISNGYHLSLSHRLNIEFYPYSDSDFNRDGAVDLEDFTTLAADWGKSGGQYAGDKTGPSGIPDGNVDMYDLAEFVTQWLE